MFFVITMLILAKLQTFAKNAFNLEWIRKFLFRVIQKYYEIQILFRNIFKIL
jgi:hypothetical protein